MTPKFALMSAETLRLYRDFAFAANRYGLSERAWYVAWQSATGAPVEAGACYRAIAASLRITSPPAR